MNNKIYVEFTIEEWELLKGMVRELEEICTKMIENNQVSKETKNGLEKRQKQIIEVGACLSVQDLVNMGALTREDHPVVVMENYYKNLDNKED